MIITSDNMTLEPRHRKITMRQSNHHIMKSIYGFLFSSQAGLIVAYPVGVLGHMGRVCTMMVDEVSIHEPPLDAA